MEHAFVFRTEYYKPSHSERELGELNHNVLESYQRKLHVFYQLVQKYKTALSSSVDDAFYNGMTLLVGIVQSNYQQLDLNRDYSAMAPYNFYKDSNISEIHQIADLLKRLEARVLVELQQWPDHAVLNDVSFGSALQWISKVNFVFFATF